MTDTFLFAQILSPGTHGLGSVQATRAVLCERRSLRWPTTTIRFCCNTAKAFDIAADDARKLRGEMPTATMTREADDRSQSALSRKTCIMRSSSAPCLLQKGGPMAASAAAQAVAPPRCMLDPAQFSVGCNQKRKGPALQRLGPCGSTRAGARAETTPPFSRKRTPGSTPAHQPVREDHADEQHLDQLSRVWDQH